MTVIPILMGDAGEGNKDIEVDMVFGENDERLQFEEGTPNLLFKLCLRRRISCDD